MDIGHQVTKVLCRLRSKQVGASAEHLKRARCMVQDHESMLKGRNRAPSTTRRSRPPSGGLNCGVNRDEGQGELHAELARERSGQHTKELPVKPGRGRLLVISMFGKLVDAPSAKRPRGGLSNSDHQRLCVWAPLVHRQQLLRRESEHELLTDAGEHGFRPVGYERHIVAEEIKDPRAL
ncbi:hypothetical protein [Okibacterium fritillariae]|uniref:hypothetical protein n=1 Tax=Okibacterium fritillariae TaxID=123320 RepID=UPI00190EFC45|nr:hypothetical protein [Okibacterium fritillariae]